MNADVAVVGGGVAGLAVARQCLARGLKPAVIEARDLASGATGRNAGFAMTGLSDPYATLIETFGRAMAREIWVTSQANLRELVDEVAMREQIDCDLRPYGSLVAGWTQDETALLSRSCELLREDGFDVAWCEGTALAERLQSLRYQGAISVAADHGVHPVKLVHGLAQRVKTQGGFVLENHEVRRVEQHSEGVRVHTGRARVDARYAVLCTNAYTRALEPTLGQHVRPMRGQALCLEGVQNPLQTLLYTDDGFEYARPLGHDRVVAGGWRRAFAHDEVGLGDEATDGVQQGIEQWVRESWPQWSAARVSHRWSGAMGFSADGLPLVGVLADRSRVGYAVGFTGHGLGFAFAAARAVMRCLLGEGSAGIFAPRIARV